MSFGGDNSDWRDWMLGEDENREVIERTVELGINFFDTANVYSIGNREAVVGDVLSEYDRDRSVVATKVHPYKRPDNYQMTDDCALSCK